MAAPTMPTRAKFHAWPSEQQFMSASPRRKCSCRISERRGMLALMQNLAGDLRSTATPNPRPTVLDHRLEIQLQSQLHFARGVGQKRNLAERAVTKNRIGSGKIRMVKHVERFQAKLQAHS